MSTILLMQPVSYRQEFSQKATIAASLRERVWDMLADGRIAKPLLHRVFDYRDIQEAHREIDRGTHIGKILLDFTPSNC